MIFECYFHDKDHKTLDDLLTLFLLCHPYATYCLCGLKGQMTVGPIDMTIKKMTSHLILFSVNAIIHHDSYYYNWEEGEWHRRHKSHITSMDET